MKFATKEFPANGQAALALVVALIESMEKNGKLSPTDTHDIIAAAKRLAPQGVGRIDKEAQEILASLP